MLNRAISIGSAGLIAIGVNYTWNPQTRGLLFIIPTFGGLLIGLWHWLNQYALNETIYQATVSKVSTLNGTTSTTPTKIGV